MTASCVDIIISTLSLAAVAAFWLSSCSSFNSQTNKPPIVELGRCYCQSRSKWQRCLLAINSCGNSLAVQRFDSNVDITALIVQIAIAWQTLWISIPLFDSQLFDPLWIFALCSHRSGPGSRTGLGRWWGSAEISLSALLGVQTRL